LLELLTLILEAVHLSIEYIILLNLPQLTLYEIIVYKQKTINLLLSSVTGKKTNNNKFRLILFYLSTALFSTPSFSYDQQELEAVYLGVVSKHVTWPAYYTIQNSNSFNICIFGNDTFGGHLKFYNNKKIKNKPVRISYPQKIENLSNCQVLFIGQSKRKNLAEIFNFTDNKAILTISLIRGFAEKKGMVQFYENRSQLDIKINYQETLRHGFDIKASLLRYSKVINR